MKEVPDFEDVVKMLYKEERLNKRENTTQAMAAQFKRFQKDQKDQKNSRSSSRSSRASGSTLPTTDPKYEGVGTRPECPTYNNGRRHQPKQCWTLHPDRRP